MAQTGDQIGDLHARQLTAFTWLRPLRDLDLKLFTLVEIFRSHAKAARSNLLDFRRWIVTIGFGVKMRGILAPFAAIRFGPDTVHRDV